jgi:orotidine 5'-phosphate decarboxylase subfamily 2
MIQDFDIRGQPASFVSRISERAHAIRTWLCVGLDPDITRLPAHIPRTAAGVTAFCSEIIESTHDLAAGFKINFAFFEALGSDGWQALEQVRNAIPPEIPVIADAKRGDIPHTAAAYARAVFGVLNFDALTVSPYVGWDAVEAFAQYPGTCVFILCKTSNAGASDFQDVLVGDVPLYIKVAREGLALNTVADLGFVVGATQPAALEAVRAISEEALLLVPGVGAQGAEANRALQLAVNHRGDNALFPVSREILYASSTGDFALAARAATLARARELWIDHEFPHAGR